MDRFEELRQRGMAMYKAIGGTLLALIVAGNIPERNMNLSHKEFELRRALTLGESPFSHKFCENITKYNVDLNREPRKEYFRCLRELRDLESQLNDKYHGKIYNNIMIPSGKYSIKLLKDFQIQYKTKLKL